MSTLATLVVKLVADADGLTKGLDQSARETESFMDKLGTNVQAVGTAALAGLAGISAAAIGAGAALAGMTIDAAPVEGVSKAFEGLAQSAGMGADEMLAALKRGSSGMVSNRDLMLSFNKAASLVSTDFAVQLPDAMEYLSKVSASTGQDMGFLMDSMVTGVGRMSPMILDNLGIQVDMAQATDRAAQMFGVEADALTDSQKQAGLMNVVLEKLQENTAAMPDTTQSAAAKMAQFKASMQDTKDQIGTAFLPILSEVMTGLGNLASTILPPVVDFLTRMSETMKPIVEAFGDFIGRLSEGTDPMTAFKVLLMELLPPEMFVKVNEIVTAIQNFIDKAQEVLQPVTDWLGKNVELQDILAGLGLAIMTVVVPALAGIIAAAAPVIGTALLLIGAVTAIRLAWENDFLGIKTFVTNTLDGIKAFWAEHGEAIKAKAQEMWDKVKEIFEVWKGQVQKLLEAFSLAFQGDWRGFGEKLREYWDEAWRMIKEIGTKAWDAIKKFFTETDWGAVGKSITEGIANAIKNGVSAIADAAKEAAKAALEAAKGFLGIESPSKAFMWLGEMSVKGFMLPFDNADMRPIEEAMRKVTGVAEDGALSRVDNSRVMNVTINTQQDTGSIYRDLLLVEALV